MALQRQKQQARLWCKCEFHSSHVSCCSADLGRLTNALARVAGTDSVAVALRMALLYILSTPRAYNKLMNELTGAAEAGLASTPIRDAEAKKLPYLQAVIREGMRIFASQTPLLNK